MIPYNTNQEKLILPEYGRLVHEMVKECALLPDKDTRTAMAYVIVDVMKSMVQEKGKLNDDRKYWDHLYVISGRTLDVDSPYGIPEDEEVNPSPAKIPYSNSDFGMRHYGHILQRLVREVSLMENSPEKDACVELLANHIKKSLSISNAENATDAKVFADLASLSKGSIEVEEGIFDLPEFKEDKPVKAQKRKKNR